MTLPTNPSKQEVLAHIIASMNRQGRLSFDPAGSSTKLYPRYKDSTGAKCPIAHCYNEYDFDFVKGEANRETITALNERGLLIKDLAWMAEPEMLEFLYIVQKAHDISSSFKTWENIIADVALAFRLKLYA